jgi:hypothetical protein
MQRVLGEPAEGEGGHVRAADDHGTGPPHVGHHCAVRGGNAIDEGGNAVRRRFADHVDVELDRHRHTVQTSHLPRCARPQRILPACRLEDAFAVRVDRRVEPGINRIDAREEGLRHLHTGDGPRPDPRGDVRRFPLPHLARERTERCRASGGPLCFGHACCASVQLDVAAGDDLPVDHGASFDCAACLRRRPRRGLEAEGLQASLHLGAGDGGEQVLVDPVA